MFVSNVAFNGSKSRIITQVGQRRILATEMSCYRGMLTIRWVHTSQKLTGFEVRGENRYFLCQAAKRIGQALAGHTLKHEGHVNMLVMESIV